MTEFVYFLESPEPLIQCTTGRRSKLPVPKPSTEDLSLWNLMKRNIGKDLSKVMRRAARLVLCLSLAFYFR